MKLTSCFKKILKIPEEFTEIHQSCGQPWNAWISTDRGFSTFQTGLFWQFLEHLMHCEDCRNEIGVDVETVKNLLHEIEQEWEIVMK